MRVRPIHLLVSGLALATTMAPTVHAQTPRASTAIRPVGRQQIQPTAKQLDYKDDAAKAETLTYPMLTASVASGMGVNVLAWLYHPSVIKEGGGSAAAFLGPSQGGAGASQGSYVWVAATVPAGQYHVRFNFQHESGTVPTTVSIHSGGTPSDPVIASCKISGSVQSCDAIISNTGTSFRVTASLDAGSELGFKSVYLAPTAVLGS